MPDPKPHLRSKAKPAALACLILLAAAAACLWLTGQFFLNRAAGLLGLNTEAASLKADVIIGLPVVKIFWARNLRLEFKGENGDSTYRLGNVYARWFSGRISGWNFRVKNATLDWRGLARAETGRLGFNAAYDSTARKISLTETGCENMALIISGARPVEAALKNISAQELAFGLGQKDKLLGLELAFMGLAVDEVTMMAGPPENPRQIRPFSAAFSGNIDMRGWKIDFEMNRPEAPANPAQPPAGDSAALAAEKNGAGGLPTDLSETAPDKAADEAEKSAWAGLWAQAKDKAGQALDFKDLLDLNHFGFTAEGLWKEEKADGGRGFSFPGLQNLIFKGESAPAEKSKMAEWIKARFRKNESGEVHD